MRNWLEFTPLNHTDISQSIPVTATMQPSPRGFPPRSVMISDVAGSASATPIIPVLAHPTVNPAPSQHMLTSPSPVIVNGVIQVTPAAVVANAQNPTVTSGSVGNGCADPISATSDEGQPGLSQTHTQPDTHTLQQSRQSSPFVVLCKCGACGEEVFAAPPGRSNPKFCPHCTHSLLQ